MTLRAMFSRNSRECSLEGTKLTGCRVDVFFLPSYAVGSSKWALLVSAMTNATKVPLVWLTPRKSSNETRPGCYVQRRQAVYRSRKDRDKAHGFGRAGNNRTQLKDIQQLGTC